MSSPTRLGYMGNPKLRRAYTKVAMTGHEVSEFAKCANDPIYFIKTYMRIVVLGKGIQPFLLYAFQQEMIETFERERFTLCKIARQSGKSITVIGYILWLILFHENYSVAILAHKGSAANGLLGRLRLAFENLPIWLQSGIIEWNKGNIELENGSKVGAFATSADGLRSGSYDCVLMDEYAFVPDNIADAFITSTYPVITAGTDTKIIIVSTPKGMNHFHKMWVKAKKGRSEYFPIEYNWNAVPWRDEKWKEQTIRNTSQEQFDQEFECLFLGSSNTLISGKKLQELLDGYDEPRYIDENLTVYEEPKRNHTYCMTVDVSEGLGLDFSTYSIFDVTELPYKQVAKFRDNKVPLLLYPTKIVTTAKKYNDAFVLVEINSIGLQVADIIHHELAYENLIKIELKGKQGQQFTPGFKRRIAFGIKTSKQTKMIGCTNLKALIEKDKLLIKDIDTISELTRFVVDKQTYKAEEGANDDLAMTLVHFGWLTGQKFFKESIGSDIRKSIQQEQMDLMDQDIVPFGFIDDGLNKDSDVEIDRNGDIWVNDRANLYPFDHLDWNGLSNRWKL